MTKPNSLRRRPSTPNLGNLAQQIYTADPASPPETPTTSPEISRKNSLKPRHQPPFYDFTFSVNDPSIRPVGNGHQFSYRPVVGPEQLSPRSSSSSSEIAEGSSDDGSSAIVAVQSLPDPSVTGHAGNGGPNSAGPASEESEADESMGASDDDIDESEEDEAEEEETEEDGEGSSGSEADIPVAAATAAAVLFDFILEELDPMDSDWDASDVLQPYEVDSNRSRSSSWHKELPRSMQELGIACPNDSSDDDGDMDPEDLAFRMRQQELRRIRRASMTSSFGKRTHSERSDSDNEEYGPLDVNEVGSSARRLRKRLHRTSLLFNDPPEQILELEEPNSDEEQNNEDFLAQELPYFSMEIMEVDSS